MKRICFHGVDPSITRWATTKARSFNELPVFFRYLIFTAKRIGKEIYRRRNLFFQLIPATDNLVPGLFSRDFSKVGMRPGMGPDFKTRAAQPTHLFPCHPWVAIDKTSIPPGNKFSVDELSNH